MVYPYRLCRFSAPLAILLVNSRLMPITMSLLNFSIMGTTRVRFNIEGLANVENRMEALIRGLSIYNTNLINGQSQLISVSRITCRLATYIPSPPHFVTPIRNKVFLFLFFFLFLLFFALLLIMDYESSSALTR